MTILRQSGLERRNFGQGAASFCNYAGQMRYKQPWGAKSNTATILLLPARERGFFYLYPVAHSHDGMGELAMQTLAVGGKLALSLGVLPPDHLIPLTLF